MAYTNLEELRKLAPDETLAALTDDEGLGAVNAERVDEAVNQASSEIDAYLRPRYAVPLRDAPDMITLIASEMALYRLYLRRMEQAPLERRKRYEDALKTLEKIRSGELALNAMTASGIQEAGESNRLDGQNVFTRNSLGGF